MLEPNSPFLALRSIDHVIDGTAYHWKEVGDPRATPLIMVHGFMAHSMAFRRVLPPLARRYRLIAPDLPAHGRDRSFQDSLVRPDVESLEAWLRRFARGVLGTETAHWIGHSLGATLVYRLAQAHAVPMRSMVLTSPGLRIPSSPLISYALDRMPPRIATLGANRIGLAVYQPLNWRGAPMTDAEAEEYLRPLRSAERMGFMLRLGARLLEGRHPRVQPLEVPTLVLWGAQDHILPLEDAAWMGDRLDADVKIIADSGHSIMEDTPAEFVLALQRFLIEQGPDTARR